MPSEYVEIMWNRMQREKAEAEAKKQKEQTPVRVYYAVIGFDHFTGEYVGYAFDLRSEAVAKKAEWAQDPLMSELTIQLVEEQFTVDLHQRLVDIPSWQRYCQGYDENLW